MAQKFIPSNRCEDEKTLTQLRYLQRSAAALERVLLKNGDVPSWVKSRVGRASTEMSVAASHALQQNEKERAK